MRTALLSIPGHLRSWWRGLGISGWCACGEQIGGYWFSSPWTHLARCPVEQARAGARRAALDSGKDPEAAEYLAVREATRQSHGLFSGEVLTSFRDVRHGEWVALLPPAGTGETLIATTRYGSRADVVWSVMEQAIEWAGRRP